MTIPEDTLFLICNRKGILENIQRAINAQLAGIHVAGDYPLDSLYDMQKSATEELQLLLEGKLNGADNEQEAQE